SAAYPEDHRGASVGQGADHDGADGRQGLLRQRCVESSNDGQWHVAGIPEQPLKTAMLKSAAVGDHGRRFHVRAMTCGVVLVFLFTPIAAAQSSDSLVPDLVAKLAAALPTGTPLTLTVDRGDDAEDTAGIRVRVTAQLA